MLINLTMIRKTIFTLLKFNYYLSIGFGIVGIFIGTILGFYKVKYKILKNYELYEKYNKFIEYSNSFSFNIIYYMLVCLILGLVLPLLIIIIFGYYLFTNYIKKNK
jgi:uncharacterized protein YneF (UPF0154 family)